MVHDEDFEFLARNIFHAPTKALITRVLWDLALQKGFATPGVEAKELFRPLNQLSGQVAVSDTLTLGGQYFLEWESFRYPEGGTYYGPVDFAFNGPDRVVAGQLPNIPQLGPLNLGVTVLHGKATLWGPVPSARSPSPAGATTSVASSATALR